VVGRAFSMEAVATFERVVIAALGWIHKQIISCIFDHKNLELGSPA
jgi:hypothetical protein